MAEPAPSPEALRRAQVFWRQAQDDAKAARKQHKAGKFLESGYLSFQTALNALMVVAYLHGEFRAPNFSTAKLAALCGGLDPRFAPLEAPAVALEDVQAHSPFQPPADPAALAPLSAASLEHARTVLDAVQAYLSEHRRRFFKP